MPPGPAEDEDFVVDQNIFYIHSPVADLKPLVPPPVYLEPSSHLRRRTAFEESSHHAEEVHQPKELFSQDDIVDVSDELAAFEAWMNSDAVMIVDKMD